jgi:GR25 family glycosyltransferase involved in LPS biosynthesis
MDVFWRTIDVIQCITLRTRPERRALAELQFASVGLLDRVKFLEREPDVEDGKRGCFHSHQAAAAHALQQSARYALIFEDDVQFLPHFTGHAASRAAHFIEHTMEEWEIFFLGHFARKMELTSQPDIVRVRAMDGHAYVLSREGMQKLCSLEYRGDQVDVHFHYESTQAFALYPMIAVQAALYSDTEEMQREADWNDDKLKREQDLYQACVRRSAVEAAMRQLGLPNGLDPGSLQTKRSDV